VLFFGASRLCLICTQKDMSVDVFDFELFGEIGKPFG
jgi:hypothetical protein